MWQPDKHVSIKSDLRMMRARLAGDTKGLSEAERKQVEDSNAALKRLFETTNAIERQAVEEMKSVNKALEAMSPGKK